jgi:hypothetical protein
MNGLIINILVDITDILDVSVNGKKQPQKYMVGTQYNVLGVENKHLIKYIANNVTVGLIIMTWNVINVL